MKLKRGDKVEITGFWDGYNKSVDPDDYSKPYSGIVITDKEKFEKEFPDRIGYVNYISDKIIPGKTYVILKGTYQEDWEAYGYGFYEENLKKID